MDFWTKKIVQYDGLIWSECISILPDNLSSSPAFSFFNDNVLFSGSEYLED